MSKKTALIIGAGPAGLTAAYEFLKRSDIRPVVFEATDMVGGIARTVNYGGNRIDIGGHRFFSKSARVTRWWLSVFPLQRIQTSDIEQAVKILGDAADSPEAGDLEAGPDPTKTDRVMLFRSRISRILYRRQFFKYPLSLEFATFRKMGLMNTARIGVSYIWAKLFPIKPEASLEDFFINRFGRRLYTTFFKNYTEKVWGVPCTAIKPDWGAQRIKGVSISKVLGQAIKSLLTKRMGYRQKEVETSLVDYFLYPKFGPGQLWEDVAAQVQEKGGEILLRHTVMGLHADGTRITRVDVRDEATGKIHSVDADYVISTMPVRDLVQGIDGEVPADVKLTAHELRYRDFVTVGVLYSKLNTPDGKLPDNWIYVQEADVKVGRIQVFSNWSPYLTRNQDQTWLGLEYFCLEDDELWSMTEKEMLNLGIQELHSLGLADPKNFLDGVVIRMPKAYPAYFGGYERFHLIRQYIDRFENLFLIGRNGMHRYNNQDHSMLTAMTVVDNILAHITSKENIWAVNTEAEYHEKK
jgi:protoporphyrinogen oxidase